MKATETKSTHSQQHTAKDKSSAEQAQELPFFSESTAEQPAFFQPGGISHIQPKLIFGSRSFFQPSRVPTIQAKCAECEAEERQQEEGQGDIPEVQQMPAFESDEAPVQAKLTVEQPGNQYEQEADRVAATVVNRMNTPGLGNLSQPQSVETRFQGNSEFQQRVFRQAVDASVPNVQGDFETALNSAKGGGSPLDNVFRAKVEPEMGADFSEVKVHTDAEADRLNRSIQAKAFTKGQDIFFRKGSYEPGSQQGQELLAHELTHVLQQNQSLSQFHGSQIQLSPDDGEPYERMRRRAVETARLERARGFMLQELDLTEWEQRIAYDLAYRPVFEDEGTLLLGYYRSSGGYEEIRDREGTIVWSDEIGLETPLLSPVDLIGPGVIRVGGRLGIRFVGLFISGFAARQTARGIGLAAARRAGQAVMDRLRQTATRVIARLAARQQIRAVAREAQRLVVSIREQFGRVVANLGGEGEVANVINVNNLSAVGESGVAIPNLVRASAEQIGRIFRPSSLDEIISHQLIPTSFNWSQVASGCFRVLRSGSRVTIRFRWSDPEQARRLIQALRRAGFPQDAIQNFPLAGGGPSNAVIIAIKP